MLKWHHTPQPSALEDVQTDDSQVLNAYGIIGMCCSVFLCIFVCIWHKQRQIVVRFSTTLSSEIKRRSTVPNMPRASYNVPYGGNAKRLKSQPKSGNNSSDKPNVITISGLCEGEQDIFIQGQVLPSQSRSVSHLSNSRSRVGSKSLNLDQEIHQLSSRSSERLHRNTDSLSVSKTPLRSESFTKRMISDMTSTIGRAAAYFRPSNSTATPASQDGDSSRGDPSRSQSLTVPRKSGTWRSFNNPGRLSDREVRRASIIANKRHLGNLTTSRSKSDGAIKALHEIHPKAASSANVHKFVQKSLQDCTLYE